MANNKDVTSEPYTCLPSGHRDVKRIFSLPLMLIRELLGLRPIAEVKQLEWVCTPVQTRKSRVLADRQPSSLLPSLKTREK